MNVFTASEMRECDRQTIEEGDIPGVCLMEAAGIALADACAEELGGHVRGKTIAVLCGKGNNGGDGFVAARHLHTRGAKPYVYLVGFEPGEVTGDAAIHLAAFGKKGRIIIPASRLPDVDAPPILRPTSSIVFAAVLDCVYGTGFRPPLPHMLIALAWDIRHLGVPVISCDIPSGVDADTGEVGEGGAFTANRTVCLAGLKRGLLLYPGASYAGRVTVAPIGMPPDILNGVATATLTTAEWVRGKLPPRVQSRDANKGRFGTVLIIAGSAGMAGAATLAASAALRAGAGLVHLAVPESLLDTAATLAPEVVLHGLPETPHRSHGGAGAVEIALQLAEKADAVAIGCGIGAKGAAKSFVQMFVTGLPAQKMLVIDADGLNALADTAGESLAHRTAAQTILTPHPGEAGRLLRQEARAVQTDRAQAAQSLARLYHATVLLKGARTLIATDLPSERLSINRSGSVALATAGSGDVLTGVLAALLADRENALVAPDAARIGAFIHAVAGEICEQKRGAVGTRAAEICDALPEARTRLYADGLGSLNDV